MKKVLLLLLSITFFLSCSSNNDKPNIDDSPLAGKWHFAHQDIDGVRQSSKICNAIETITIGTENQTAVWYTPFEDTPPCEPITYNFTYTINGDVITLTDPDVPTLKVTITEFTKDILKIKGSNWETTFGRATAN